MASLTSTSSDVPSPAADQWVIEPRGRTMFGQLREVWVYRRLFVYFGKRSIERLYRNTALGPAWLFIRPLFPVAIRTLVFGGVLGVGAPGAVPYFLFALVGSSVWDLFSSCLMWATRSLQMNRSFLGRMYFPRVIVPAAMMSLAFVNFLIMTGVMAVAMAYYYVTQGQIFLNGWTGVPWAIGAVLVAVTLGLAIGLWTSPMNAQYRDVRFTLAYILEFWALLTPVMYPLSKIPPQYHWIVFINPLAGVVQAFKWGVLGIEELDPTIFLIDAVLTLVILLSGLWYFTRVEAQAVDRS
jgi:lipopolysaccharide transport system permease protein